MIPLTYRAGDLAEVDFFEVLIVAGRRRKAWLFVLRLMYSGRDFGWIYERQDQISFLDGHVRAFALLGGVPRADPAATVCIQLTNASRLADTSGRSISLGRGRFFYARSRRGAASVESWSSLKFLPPPFRTTSTPIESVWALVKKDIKRFAPRTAGALRRVARAARHVVTPEHCRRFFTYIGYVNSTA